MTVWAPITVGIKYLTIESGASLSILITLSARNNAGQESFIAKCRKYFGPSHFRLVLKAC